MKGISVIKRPVSEKFVNTAKIKKNVLKLVEMLTYFKRDSLETNERCRSAKSPNFTYVCVVCVYVGVSGKFVPPPHPPSPLLYKRPRPV